MPAEDDLRTLFSAGAESDQVAPIDTDRVIARSRARRRPRQLAAGAVGVLTVAAVVLVGAQTLRIAPEIRASTSETGGSALAPQSAPSAGADSTKTANALNRCGSSVAAVAPSPSGLTLTIDFPASATTAAGSIQGTVHLANRGTERIAGRTSAAPTITLSQGGVVIWHSNGPADSTARHIDLAPGQSIDYPASFRPVRCAAADEGAGPFRADLPAVPPGAYDLSAAINVIPDATATGSVAAVELVSGATARIDLR